MRKLITLMLGLALVASAQVKKKIIVPAGGTSGPNFPPGLLVGDSLYVSAFIGFDSKTNQIPASFEEEMTNAIQHARDVLKAGGMDLEDVVSAQVYLTDMKLFDRMNKVYLQHFKTDPKPTRTTVQVSSLADAGRGAHVTLTVTARK